MMPAAITFFPRICATIRGDNLSQSGFRTRARHSKAKAAPGCYVRPFHGRESRNRLFTRIYIWISGGFSPT